MGGRDSLIVVFRRIKFIKSVINAQLTYTNLTRTQHATPHWRKSLLQSHVLGDTPIEKKQAVSRGKGFELRVIVIKMGHQRDQ